VTGGLLFLAMAHHRLGHVGETKKSLAKAQQWIDQTAQEKRKGGTAAAAPLPWDHRLELKLIRAEAEALLKEGPAKK
jgi:hypothetical protein